jgi:hypothetical protein
MGAVLLTRSLKPLNFALIGQATDVALQLHRGRLPQAIFQAVILSLSLVLPAAISYPAKNAWQRPG